MDLLRGCALLLVIFLHSTTILERFGIERADWIRHVNDSFAPFRIPLLIFLSGLLLSASIAKSPEAYFSGKIRNIAYPYVIWTFIYAALIGIDHSWYNPKFWIGPTYLWYLFFLLIYYASAFVLRDVRPLIVCAVALAASVVAPDDSKYGERLLYLMSFFFLGYSVSTWPVWNRIMESRWPLFLSPLILIFSALSAVYGPYRYGAEFFVFSFASIVLLCVLARNVAHLAGARPLIYVGQNGIVFYVVHYPVIYLTMLALTGFGVRSAVLLSAASLAAALAATFLFSTLAGRFSWARLLFIGPPVDGLIVLLRRGKPRVSEDAT
jgi:surface polysaccharide O-acyltransferase-like enzyme